jgi:hypothetical protein
MLFRGLLTLTADINEVPFVFKSLNHHELELLRFCGGDQPNESFWNTFLAYGVFMVDGANVLAERDRWLPEIARTFGELPASARARVIRHLSEVSRRASNAVALTEAYCTEVYSRYHWAQLRGTDLTSPAVTGIDGTQRLGLNWAQLVWRALNYFEDRNDQHEREWENAKFVGGCMAGKGISKIYTQDNDRRQKEKEERLARKDKLLRQVILGEDVEETAQQFQGAVVLAARSVDELAEQLQHDLRGEKDWHDRVIEEEERRAREVIRTRQQQLEDLAKAHEQEYGPLRVTGGTGFEGLTPEEVQFRVERQRQLEAQSVAKRMVRPELDEKTAAFMSKWGVLGDEVETHVSTTDRDVSGAVPLSPSRKPGTPFGRR